MNGTSSAGYCGRRTCPSYPCGPRCGPHRWPVYECHAEHTPGRKAPAGAARDGDHPTILASGTSSAKTEPLRCDAGGSWPCVPGSTHHVSAHYILDADTVGAASWPRAITSGQNKKPAPTLSAIADHVAQALRHRHSSIFTTDSCLQTLQNTVRSFALVPGLSFKTFPRPHLGHIKHPSFTISLALLAITCNSFLLFLSVIQLYSKIESLI